MEVFGRGGREEGAGGWEGRDVYEIEEVCVCVCVCVLRERERERERVNRYFLFHFLSSASSLPLPLNHFLSPEPLQIDR